MHLMVIADFEGRRRGDVITDAVSVANIQGSSHAAFVVAIDHAREAVPSDPPGSEPAPPAIIKD